MKRLAFALTLALGVCALAQPLTFKFENDHPEALYKCGEVAEFKVTAMNTNGTKAVNGEVSANLDNFGPLVIGKEKIDLAKTNPFTVKGTLDKPGFLRLNLSAADTKGCCWSVGFEPKKIQKGSPSPSDFVAFWMKAKAKLANEVPLDAKITKMPEQSSPNIDFYRISFATFGRRVHGYMSVPTDKSKAPFPVSFEVSAAGYGNWTNTMWPQANRICVFFSVYPFEPTYDWNKPAERAKYEQLNKESKQKYGTSGYSQAGIAVSREEYFFYPVILGIDRAVDWLAERPDVDEKHFTYFGTSQGGGFGFYLTGLNHHFTKAVFFVPAITDTMGYLAGRQSGWPQIIENQPKDKKPAAERNAPYFDAANFASRIQCPVRVAVGFSDTTCPPCAVYSAFNEIRVKDKDIVHGLGMTHSCRKDIYDQLKSWLNRD